VPQYRRDECIPLCRAGHRRDFREQLAGARQGARVGRRGRVPPTELRKSREAQGPSQQRGRLFLLTFFGEIEKVSRLAPMDIERCAMPDSRRKDRSVSTWRRWVANSIVMAPALRFGNRTWTLRRPHATGAAVATSLASRSLETRGSAVNDEVPLSRPKRLAHTPPTR
jgi:hypothetical protein